MADSVSADRPLLILRDELLTHIAVDTMEDVNVIFVYSHKLVLTTFQNNSFVWKFQLINT